MTPASSIIYDEALLAFLRSFTYKLQRAYVNVVVIVTE